MKIDHVGYAVKRIDRAKKGFELLGFQFEEVIDDYDRNVALCFGEKDGYRIELVQPLCKERPSPVDTYLNHVGPIPYHFCYSSAEFEKEIGELSASGFRTVITPQEAVAFDGKKVVFMMNLGVGMIEIVEADK